jgi:hypothetical protein
MADPQNAQLREAIQELQLYLSDTLPPLVVADSVGLLLEYPPQLVAEQIQAWTGSQYRPGSGIPISDYLFHAVRKIHMMWEFNLVPREPFFEYLEGLKTEVLASCPEGDREFLQESFARLGESVGALPPSVDSLLRQRRPHAADAPGVASGQDLLNSRRLSLLLDRLEGEVRAGGGSPGAGWKDRPAMAQTLAAAARGAQTAKDIERLLGRLRDIGLDVGTKDVIQSLGKSLPGWVPPASARDLPGADVPTASGVEAMRKIVTLAEDPVESLRRFHEMVRAAIERFNDGSLAQAVTMLDLGKRLIEEGAVDRTSADAIRSKEDDALDVERMRRYAEAPDQHSLLRDFLSFFTRLAPEGLLTDLRTELKRERRRLLLLLLEVHGLTSREIVLARLHTPIGQGVGDEDWYFRRNLLYLVRRIPRQAGASPEEDVDVAIRHAELKFPAPLVKEAIANLGQLKYEKSERTLIGLLQNLETMLTKTAEPSYDPREARLLLDRVVAALARFGTPGARRAVVEHGLKAKAELGDTVARLAELSGQDFSGDEDVIERLLAAVKANTPFKLFGLVLKKDRNLPSLVEALSGTPHPAVREALEEIARRFPGEDAGRTAAKALESFAHAPASPAAEAPGAGPSLSGDLELFGLPALLQSLAESGISGLATLRSPKGDVFGTLILRGGKLKSCQTGQLVGDEAFYQLLERPLPGNFLFARQAEAGTDEPASGLREILPLTLEGMRRFDELQQASALVPDDAALKPTEVKPTPHPREKDGILVNDLWNRVSRTATARQCEAEIKADSYRIRRLLAHWVVTGALSAA